MKKTVFFSFLFISSITSAQDVSPQFRDSLTHYQYQLHKMIRDNQDSLRRSEGYRTLQQNIERLRGKSKNYAGQVFVTGIQHTSYGAFNNSISQDGFEPMKAISAQGGFGVSTKQENIMLDMYFGVIGSQITSEKGDEEITLTLGNVLQFDLGYDVVPAIGISLYPYAGVSLRISTLEYSVDPVLNPNYTNLTNMVINDRSVSSSSTRLGFQAGLGFDVMIFKGGGRRAGLYLFTKTGINRPVWRDKYKINGVKYDPGIKQGDWGISFGLKVAHWE